MAVLVAAIVLLGAAALAYFSGSTQARPPLVVYCAHDSLYAQPILEKFQLQTGIPVNVRFDTEATKSLGLVSLLLREKEHPRCDVFWNNELLGTMQLQREGLLLPYQGAGYDRFPAAFKDPDGHWTGFGARMRVYIVNTRRMPATEEAVEQALEGDLSRMALAKPLYGTTRTHYTMLWDLRGGEHLKQWHREVRERGVREVAGNATVKNLVAQGTCDFGWTDSDDYFVALDAGRPVDMLPVRAGGATISIPNTLAIIRGTERLSDAQRLVDYLLSAQTELALANSKSRQIPLGPVDEHLVPKEVERLRRWAQDGYDLTRLGPAAEECLEWLKSEYVP